MHLDMFGPRSKSLPFVILTVLLASPLVPTARQASAATIVVNTLSGTTSGTDPHCSLPEAVFAATLDASAMGCTAGSGDDDIVFSVSGTIDLTSSMSVGSSQALTIDGGGNITIDRGGSGTIFATFGGGTLTLSNITLTNGGTGISAQDTSLDLDTVTLSQLSTTAIDASSSPLTLTGCTLSGNGKGIYKHDVNTPAAAATVSASTFSGNHSGAIDNLDGLLTVESSTFSSNAGGAITNTVGSTLHVTSSTFASNHSSIGGALFNNGVATVAGSTFTDNYVNKPSSNTGGGAIYSYSGSASLTVSDSEFSGNTVTANVGTGGAIGGGAGPLTVRTTVFHDNAVTGSVRGSGGAIGFEDGGTITLGNVTITHNSSSTTGTGGIYMGGGHLYLTNSTSTNGLRGYGLSTQYLTLENSIVKAGCGNFTLTGSVDSFSTLASCGGTGVTIVTAADLALGSLGDYGGSTETIPLLTNSIAIDAGDNSICAIAPVNGVDQRGVARPQGVNCDAGAFELEDSTSPDTLITSGPSNPSNQGSAAFSFTGDDGTGSGVGGFQCSLDGGGYLTCASPTTYSSLADGAHAFAVRSLDRLGNVDSSPATYSWSIDATAPVVTIDQVSPDPTSGATSVTWHADENGDYSVRVGGTGCSDGTSVAAGPYTTSPSTVSLPITASDLAEGTNILRVCVADSAANTGSQTSSVVKDTTAPTVSVNSSAADPTNSSPFSVTLTFSEPVTGFSLGDISVGNGTAGNFSGSGASYNADITPLADGPVTVDVGAGVANDGAGNGNTASNQLSLVYDGTAPSVAMSSSASDPTDTAPIPLTVTFSEPVNGFTLEDISVSNGTAADFSGSGNSYSALITPATDGVVTIGIAGGVATDSAGNGNNPAPSLSRTYDATPPGVAGTSLKSSYAMTGPSSFTVTFSEPVKDPPGNVGSDDVTNPANYLLMEKGSNGIADTSSCAAGVSPDDLAIPIDSVTYDSNTSTATLLLTGPLPLGSYCLFVCGTTTIVDLAGHPLAGGTDVKVDFYVRSTTAIPATSRVGVAVLVLLLIAGALAMLRRPS